MKIQRIISTSKDGKRAEVTIKENNGSIVTRHVRKECRVWVMAFVTAGRQVMATSPLEDPDLVQA
jgi:hypothetical protein